MSLIYKGQTIANVGGSGTGGSSEEIDSAEETRIGTWVDGKPLYRISIDMGNNGAYSVANLNIDKLTRLDSIVYVPSQLRYLEMPYVEITNTVAASLIYSTSNKNLTFNGVGWILGTEKELYVTLEYTKTTDEATS